MGEYDFRTLDNILDIIDNELLETQTFQGLEEFSELNRRIKEGKCRLKREIFKRYREIGVVRSQHAVMHNIATPPHTPITLSPTVYRALC